MVDKRLFNLPIEAGIYTEETERGSAPRWHDGNKVRFRKGLPEKIGGWQRLEPQFIGKARKIIDWSSLDGRKWVAFGTEAKLYLWQESTLYDITPIRRDVTLGNNPFATTNGSSLVTVTDTAHAAQEGDYVRFDGAAAVAGLTIDGEYQIIDVLTPNTYVIDAVDLANATTTGGGAAVTAEYDISVGSDSSTVGSGWGTGGWGLGGWGEPSATSVALIQLRTWSLDTWGEDLIATPFGGAIYWWDRTNGPETRAVILDDAGTPQINNYTIVSQASRQLISLGAYDDVNAREDPLLIRWCSFEDFNDWLPGSTNTAGDIRVFNGSKLVTGIRARGEILVFTDSSVHTLQLVGAGEFGINTIGENISIMSPNAAVALDHRVFFMADGDFYVYDGVLRVLPCDVRNRVYENITVAQRAKVTAGVNRLFNEIWWFYPSLPEELWFDGDFALSLEDADMREQPVGDVPLWSEEFWSELFWSDEFWAEVGEAGTRYNVEFNSSGFIEMTEAPDVGSVYDALYFTNSDAPINDHLLVDYELIFTAIGTPDMWYGMGIHITDLHSGEDAHSDNVHGIMIEINPSTNLLRVRTRLTNGTVGGNFTNDPTDHDLTDLPEPITITDGSRYGLTVQRDGETLSIFLWDESSDLTQKVASFILTDEEQEEYSEGAAGVLFSGKESAVQQVGSLRAHSFRIADFGTLVTEIAGVEPVEYTRATADEITRYVTFNYEEGTWSIGTMPRTAWHDRSPVLEKPYAAGTDGYLYQHETGTDDNDDAMPAFIESYMVEVPDAGDDLLHIDKLIPDFLRLDGSVLVKLRGKKYPHSNANTIKGPFEIEDDTEYLNTRIRARQISLRIESREIGDRWRAGKWRGRAGAHGKR